MQAIAKKIANQTSRFSFVYEIIVIYLLTTTRTTKINTIATIIAKINAIVAIVIVMSIAANKIENLN